MQLPNPDTIIQLLRSSLKYDPSCIDSLISDFEKSLPNPSVLRKDERRVVRYIDISTSNTLSTTYSLHRKQLRGEPQVLARHQNEAIALLGKPAYDTHTRIVVLNQYDAIQHLSWSAEIRLCLDIMIDELGISPDMAAGLLRQPHLVYDKIMGIFDSTASSAGQSVSLGVNVKTPFLDWQMSTMDLGERDLGGQKVHIVVIFSDESDYVYQCGGRVSEDWRSMVQGELPASYDLVGPYVLSGIRRRQYSDLEHFMSSREGGYNDLRPTSIWINGLIRAICFRYSNKLWDSQNQLSHFGDQKYETCCQIAATQYQAAKMDLFKIKIFLKRYDQLTIQNCASILDKFHVVVEELKADYEEMSACFERRSTLRSLEMTRLSIYESRSTIRLSWLATFFIPISLASSIFGMNVREIDARTTGIWQFAATAAGILIFAAYSWCLMRAWRNYYLCFKKMPRGRNTLCIRSPLWIYQKFYEDCHESRIKVLAYLLGFRRADELGYSDSV